MLRDAPAPDPYEGLAALGCNVLGVDLPGHGRSGGRRGHLTYRAALDAIGTARVAAAERWGGAVRPVGLVGTGLGGVLAFYAALEQGPEAVDAVVCHGVLDLRDVRPALRRTRQGVLLPAAGHLRRLAPGAGRVRLPTAAVVATEDLADDPALGRALVRHPQWVRGYDLGGVGSILLSGDDKPDVAAQRVATLVVVGADDRVLPETLARGLLSRLTCPRRLWALPGAGHQLLLEHPRAVLPEVAAFLTAPST